MDPGLIYCFMILYSIFSIFTGILSLVVKSDQGNFGYEARSVLVPI